MKIKRSSQLAGLAVFALLLLPAAVFAQEEQPAERGSVDFGVRYVWGDVYGRPDLQLGPSAGANPDVSPGCIGCGTAFNPLLSTSKYEEYRDLRNGFFIRRFNATFDNVLNSRNYVSVQSYNTLYRDQTYLVTFGQYGKFKIQFRYDEIPHTYTDTARTLFTETSPGVWSFPAQIRSAAQAISFVPGTGTSSPTAANIASFMAGTGAYAGNGVVTDSNFITPMTLRKAGTVLFSYNVTPNWNINGLFRRESENGTRPIGMIMNSSPSASATSGYGVELPEAISFWTNLVRVGGEYGKESWGVQAAYVGSFFQQNIAAMVWDNPFLLNQTGFTVAQAITNPTQGQMTPYPSNHAQYLNLAGATDLGKWFRLMASVSPGWLRQDEPFLPYTINAAITGCGGVVGASCTSTASLPEPNLAGSKQTLAMNYTLVTLPWKSFQIKAAYRYYDYDNNTPIRTFTPVIGDSAAPTVPGVQNNPYGFIRKNFELTGNWVFAKKSSAKVGYQAEWMDRSYRDVAHSLENSVVAAVDVGYWKDLLFRLSYQYADRMPSAYQDLESTDPVTGALVACTNTTDTLFTADQRCSRRFDEAARIRNRADGLVQYNATSKLSLSAFGGTTQDNYNRPGGTNSPTPLNYPGAVVPSSPYYLYGILKDITYNYGFDADYAVSRQLSVFAEYSHEHYYRRLVSRDRTPPTLATTPITTCAGGCDTANNDWESTTPQLVDVWTAGADTYIGKKAYFTTYYSLSAGRANTFSWYVGNPTTLVGTPGCTAASCPTQFILLGTSAATNYPEAVNRQHEVVAIFKYKLTKNLMPKFEFRYQQFDNRDYQTSPMTQYMGCVSGAGTPGSVAGCPIAMLTSSTSPTATPVPGSSPFYPGFVVGDTSAARYLFLGADQPSYRAYYVSGSLEYHF